MQQEGVAANVQGFLDSMHPKIPIAIELLKMGKACPSMTEAAEIICMLQVIEGHERHVCSYCKTRGHKHAKCTVFHRLRDATRGDRAINKKRGRMSAELRHKSRKSYNQKTLRVIAMKK